MIVQILAALICGGLIVGFAMAAERWKQRADFWQGRYEQTHEQLLQLLDGLDEYLQVEQEVEGVVRVWASQN